MSAIAPTLRRARILELDNPASKPCVLAVDLSLTMTGWALVRLPFVQRDGSGPFVLPVIRCGDVRLKDAKRPLAARINDLCQALAAQCDDPWFVAMEVPKHIYAQPRRHHEVLNGVVAEVASPGKSLHATMVQQRTFGAVVQWLRHHLGLPVLEVDPQDTKRALTGRHNASKNEVGAALHRLFLGASPETWPKGWTEGVRDALSVAYYLDGELSRLRLGAPSALAALARGDTDAA